MRCLKNSRGENILKPTAIVDYNHHMGGFDKTDKVLSTTETVRKCKKLYKIVLLLVGFGGSKFPCGLQN